MSVASLSPSIADFAVVGSGSLTGRLVDVTGAVVRTPVDVFCDWAGADGVFGNADDSRFTTRAAADGTFTLAGVPYGTFNCRAVATTGLSSAAVSATVTSTSPTQVALPLPDPSPTPRLPATGQTNASLLAAAVAMLAIGAGLLAVTRRRPLS